MKSKHPYIYILIAFLLSTFSLDAQSNKQKALEQQRQQILKEIKEFRAIILGKKKEEKSEISLIEDLTYKVRKRQNLIRITNEQANHKS